MNVLHPIAFCLAAASLATPVFAKPLVAYFSASGTTAAVAERLAKAAGADLYEIKPDVPYAAADLNWHDANSRTSREMKDESVRPPLGAPMPDLSAYDVVYVGFPIWWGVAPRQVDTFLDQGDFVGKKLVPFATSGSSGIERAEAALEQRHSALDWQPGKRLNRASDADIAAFVAPFAAASAATPAATEATVFFTHDITPEGLMKAYRALGRPLEGRKVAVKISTGEAGNTHFLKPELIGQLVQSLNGTIVECNTTYGGSRATTERHRETIADHGFPAIAPVDILDEFGDVSLPTPAGSKCLPNDWIGAHFTNYDGFVILNHFKGHMMGGFGGALKNLSIGVASARGKRWIHSYGETDKTPNWSPEQINFIEAMAEAAGAVVNYMGDRAVYISVMNNLSIDCDCDGSPHPPEMADVGILASLDPVALDQACVDLVYASDPKTSASLRQRIESRLGPAILPHAEALGYGQRAYRLVSLDEDREPPSTARRD